MFVLYSDRFWVAETNANVLERSIFYIPELDLHRLEQSHIASFSEA